MNKIEINEIPISLIFFLTTIIYFSCVVGIYLCLLKFAPQKLRQQNNTNLIGENEYQYYCDCSCLSSICPCETISLRQYLRKTCCSFRNDVFSEIFHCECFRPLVQGTPAYKVDFICCTI